MAKLPYRFTVSIDRLDGGEPIDERKVHDIQIIAGAVRIVEGTTSTFIGGSWTWIEVRRIEEDAGAAMGIPEPPVARRPRGRRSLRTSMQAK